MLTLTTRIYIALGVLALTVIGAVVLEVTGTGADLRSALLGWAGATFVSLLDMLQARRRASERPPEPERPLTREETGRHRTIRQPPLPSDGRPVGVPMMLTEDDIDTERPPPVGALRDDDEDPDTDPQTPSAIRRHRS